MTGVTRRGFTALTASAMLAQRAALAQDSNRDAAIIQRAIPATGELLPAVGLGTARAFDSNDDRTRDAATRVVSTLLDGGGRLIDTSSVYGEAEQVLGQVMAAGGWRDKVFVATKLEAPDAAELERSQTRLATRRIDLLQLHNVSDPRQSLSRFKAWKTQGICRYVGITSTYRGAYAAIEAVLQREKPDFVQIDYSIDNRDAEARILPLAADVRAGVLTALPYGRGRLFRAVRGKPVPDWATGFATSWAQFFLKFLLGDSRVTAVIPGTSDAGHMADNLGAMRGRLPDAEERRRMVEYVRSL